MNETGAKVLEISRILAIAALGVIVLSELFMALH